MRRRMTSLSCANVTETALSRVLSLASSSSSPSSPSSSRANRLAVFARRRRGRITTTTSASFAPGGEQQRFARCCRSCCCCCSSSSFASQSLSTGLASKSRISNDAVVRNNALLLLKDARRRREDDGFQSRHLKTLSGRAASSGGDFGRLGVRARDSFSFVSFFVSLSLFARFAITIRHTSDGIYCVIFSTRERLWNEFKAEVTDRCVSLST